jgi:hypothetical protein
MPDACACGQQEFPATKPYHTHQVVELPEIHGIPTFPVLVDAVTCSFNGQPPEVSWIYRI